MVNKTLQQVSKVEFVATYNNLVYEGTELLRETKLTL